MYHHYYCYYGASMTSNNNIHVCILILLVFNSLSLLCYLLNFDPLNFSCFPFHSILAIWLFSHTIAVGAVVGQQTYNKKKLLSVCEREFFFYFTILFSSAPGCIIVRVCTIYSRKKVRKIYVDSV